MKTLTMEQTLRFGQYNKPKTVEFFKHKARMEARRERQSTRHPSVIKVPQGKYIPAGRLKNV